MFADPEPVGEYLRVTVDFHRRRNPESFDQAAGMVVVAMAENDPCDRFQVEPENGAVTQESCPLPGIKQVIASRRFD